MAETVSNEVLETEIKPLKEVHTTSFKFSTEYGKEAWNSSTTKEYDVTTHPKIIRAEKLIAQAQDIYDSVNIPIKIGSKMDVEEAVNYMDIIKELKNEAIILIKEVSEQNVPYDVTSKIHFKVKLAILKDDINKLKETIEEVYGIQFN